MAMYCFVDNVNSNVGIFAENDRDAGEGTVMWLADNAEPGEDAEAKLYRIKDGHEPNVKREPGVEEFEVNVDELKKSGALVFVDTVVFKYPDE